ncbi:ECF RNA polymerase sigma factor SigW [compost metagenome]
MTCSNEDSQLASLTLAGSREAFSQLYESTIAEVYRTARFLVGDPSDTDDVVQEIYIQLYRSLQHYDASRPFRPWLMGLVARQCRAYRRKRWSMLRIQSRSKRSPGFEDRDFAGDVVDRMAIAPLLESVERLPYKLKQVVILRYLNEYSQEEIAQALGIPLGTVKSRIHAALRKLRRKEIAEIGHTGRMEDAHET